MINIIIALRQQRKKLVNITPLAKHVTAFVVVIPKGDNSNGGVERVIRLQHWQKKIAGRCVCKYIFVDVYYFSANASQRLLVIVCKSMATRCRRCCFNTGEVKCCLAVITRNAKHASNTSAQSKNKIFHKVLVLIITPTVYLCTRFVVIFNDSSGSLLRITLKAPTAAALAGVPPLAVAVALLGGVAIIRQHSAVFAPAI